MFEYSVLQRMIGAYANVDTQSPVGSFALKVAEVMPYDLALPRGLRAGDSPVHKFGRNTAVGTSTQDIWTVGGAYTGWLQAAVAVRVKAGGNTADTAAGLGARTVTVVGLDENWTEASETLTLAGASASAATTTTFVRVYRVYVETCGTYRGNNTGNVVLETTGGVTVAQIQAAIGQSQLAMYTIPAGKKAYIRTFTARVDGNKNATVRFWQCRNVDDVTTPFSGAKRLVHEIPGLAGSATIGHGTWDEFPAKTDLWASALTLTGTAGVTVEFELILVDD